MFRPTICGMPPVGRDQVFNATIRVTRLVIFRYNIPSQVPRLHRERLPDMIGFGLVLQKGIGYVVSSKHNVVNSNTRNV